MRTNQSLLPVLASVLFVLAGHAAPADSLESGFLNPPDSARPQTWWHWMNGNITRAGITADLEAMKQIGLGGATIVNVDCGIPRGPVTFMSPEWRADFKFAVQEANRLGLKLCVENCAGWSSSGGPWNTLEQRDATRGDQRSGRDWSNELHHRAAAAAGQARISIATSPCWRFPRPPAAARKFKTLKPRTATTGDLSRLHRPLPMRPAP